MPGTMSLMVRQVPSELLQRFKRKAADTPGCTLRAVVIQLLEDYVEGKHDPFPEGVPGHLQPYRRKPLLDQAAIEEMVRRLVAEQSRRPGKRTA